MVKLYAIGSSRTILKDTQSYNPKVEVERSEQTRWENLFKEAGVFSSTSEARKNGFEGEILKGYHFWTIGKLHHEIEVLKEGIYEKGFCKCNWCK